MNPWVLSQSGLVLVEMGAMIVDESIIYLCNDKGKYILGEYVNQEEAIKVLNRMSFYIDSNRKSGGVYRMPKQGVTK